MDIDMKPVNRAFRKYFFILKISTAWGILSILNFQFLSFDHGPSLRKTLLVNTILLRF